MACISNNVAAGGIIIGTVHDGTKTLNRVKSYPDHEQGQITPCFHLEQVILNIANMLGVEGKFAAKIGRHRRWGIRRFAIQAFVI